MNKRIISEVAKMMGISITRCNNGFEIYNIYNDQRTSHINLKEVVEEMIDLAKYEAQFTGSSKEIDILKEVLSAEAN